MWSKSRPLLPGGRLLHPLPPMLEMPSCWLRLGLRAAPEAEADEEPDDGPASGNNLSEWSEKGDLPGSVCDWGCSAPSQRGSMVAVNVWGSLSVFRGCCQLKCWCQNGIREPRRAGIIGVRGKNQPASGLMQVDGVVWVTVVETWVTRPNSGDKTPGDRG